MAGFILNFEAQMLMLEVIVNKLCVPTSCPFDAVINSKFVVSFNFLNDDWIDMMPQRTDYKEYCGSVGQEQRFNGGKSMVLALPATDFCKETDGLTVEFVVRREVSKYFEIESHVMELGKLSVNVDELFNSIVEELRLRRELGDCLKLAHEKDPICKSMRHTYTLKDVDTDEATDGQIQIWMRMSHLGNNVITEVDMPSREDCDYFYAQEQSNREEGYELKELGCRDPPSSKVPLYSRVMDCAELKCTCTSEQRLRLLMDACRSIGVSTVASLVTCSSSEGGSRDSKGSKGSKGKDKGVGTGDGKKDSGTGTGKEKERGSGDGHSEDDKDDEDDWVPKKRRGTGGTSGWIDKCVPCEPCDPCCLPCVSCCVPCCDPCTPCTSYFTSYIASSPIC